MAFFYLITNVPCTETRGNMPITRWQNKIRGVRRFLRGWAKNQMGENKKKKQWQLQQ